MKILSKLVFVAAIAAVALSNQNGTEARRRQVATEDAVREALAEYPHWDGSVFGHCRAFLTAKRIGSILASSSDSLEKLQATLASDGHRDHERLDRALQMGGTIIERHPEQAARAFEALSRNSFTFPEDERDYRPRLRDLLEAARAKVGSLPREQSAELAYQLLRVAASIDLPTNRREPLEAFIREYAGTESALLAELDLIRESNTRAARRAEMFAQFARDHPGTCAAATALRMEANEVGSNMGTNADARGQDPTDRALRMIAIARQLESDAYRKCGPAFGADHPPHAFASEPVYAPGNIDRLIAAYRDYVAPRLGADAGNPGDGIGYLIVGVVRGLFKARGDGLEGLDRFLADIEKDAAQPEAVRYLRALVHVQLVPPWVEDTSTAIPDKTFALLTDLHSTGKGLYARKALATLAWLYRYYGDSGRAREHYLAYVKQYPQSPYAWVAALRAAEAAADSGDFKTAAAGYQAAAKTYGEIPAARILGHTYAARALEGAGDFEQAEREYQAAVEGWDGNHSFRYSFDASRRQTRAPASAGGWVRPEGVTLPELDGRLKEIEHAMASPGGGDIERGKWLIAHGRRHEAATLLEDFADRFPGSAHVREAQYLAHKALLYHALELLNVEGRPDEAASLAALEALAREPYDFVVSGAKIVRACVLWKRGNQADAERLLHGALEERLSKQEWREPASPLEKDLAAIRNLLFLPTGGDVYRGDGPGWNAFSWPATLPPFVIVPAEIRVKDTTGRASVVTLPSRVPGLDNVLMLDPDQLRFFTDLMVTLGGTRTRAPHGVMATPHQPAGETLTLVRLFNKFFPMRPGHWGGWEFLTYPEITEIGFTDAARTKARAKVTVGFSGCDVLLEKVDGTWKALRMENWWVT